ncbi:MAG TPA: hypothetical protein VIL78_17550 [Hanamia sp.]
MSSLQTYKTTVMLYYVQQSLVRVWPSLCGLLTGVIALQAFFFHSSLFLLAAPIAIMKNNIPSLTGIPKRSLHHILHYLVMQQIKKEKYTYSFAQRRHPHFLFQYHKNFQLVSRLKGTALCLLQTQYAKKPKNPV